MNYRHLRFFVKVVEHGSIKAAAQQLKVSQPTVSAAIHKLEREFSARLLDRRREGSVPTVFGRALYDSAVTMAGVMQAAREKIANLRDPNRGHLRIGTGPSVSIEQVSLGIARVVDGFPDLRVSQVASDTFERLEQLLVVEDIDIALCHVPAARLPDSIDCRLLASNPIVAVIAASHLRGDADRLPTEQMLLEFRWNSTRDDELLPPEGVEMSGLAREQGAPITVVAEDMQLIKHLTRTTRSVSFLPLSLVAAELRSGELVELSYRGVTSNRPIYALTRQSDDESPILGRFLAEIEQVFAQANQPPKPHRVVELV